MKIGKIKNCCKDRSTVYLYQREDGSQLISDGVAYWPVDSGLRLTEEALKSIFDIAPKAWNESWVHETIMLTEEPDMTELGAVPAHLLDEVWEASAEVQLDPVSDGVVLHRGVELMAFREDDGTCYYVPRKQLKTMDEDAQYYMLRQVGNIRVLTVYESMLTCGMVTVLRGESAREVNDTIARVINGAFK